MGVAGKKVRMNQRETVAEQTVIAAIKGRHGRPPRLSRRDATRAAARRWQSAGAGSRNAELRRRSDARRLLETHRQAARRRGRVMLPEPLVKRVPGLTGIGGVRTGSPRNGSRISSAAKDSCRKDLAIRLSHSRPVERSLIPCPPRGAAVTIEGAAAKLGVVAKAIDPDDYPSAHRVLLSAITDLRAISHGS